MKHRSDHKWKPRNPVFNELMPEQGKHIQSLVATHSEKYGFLASFLQ
jgi:hypothetical protein